MKLSTTLAVMATAFLLSAPISAMAQSFPPPEEADIPIGQDDTTGPFVAPDESDRIAEIVEEIAPGGDPANLDPNALASFLLDLEFSASAEADVQRFDGLDRTDTGHDTRIGETTERLNVNYLGDGTRAEAILRNNKRLDGHDTRIGETTERLNVNYLGDGTRAEAILRNNKRLDGHDTRIGETTERLNVNYLGDGTRAEAILRNNKEINSNAAAVGGLQSIVAHHRERMRKNTAGISMAMAMSNIPASNNTKHRFSIGLGFGAFRGETSAAAGGTARISELAYVRVSVAGNSEGAGVGAGIGIGF